MPPAFKITYSRVAQFLEHLILGAQKMLPPLMLKRIYRANLLSAHVQVALLVQFDFAS